MDRRSALIGLALLGLPLLPFGCRSKKEEVKEEDATKRQQDYFKDMGKGKPGSGK